MLKGILPIRLSYVGKHNGDAFIDAAFVSIDRVEAYFVEPFLKMYSDEINVMVGGACRILPFLILAGNPPHHIGTTREGYDGRLSLQARFEELDDGFWILYAGHARFGLQTIDKRPVDDE